MISSQVDEKKELVDRASVPVKRSTAFAPNPKTLYGVEISSGFHERMSAEEQVMLRLALSAGTTTSPRFTTGCRRYSQVKTTGEPVRP
ncbi:MAG: hypothetical protein R2706_17720 [Acidimicrobiales bacterium]